MRSTIERSVTAVHPTAQVRPGERGMVTGASGAVGAMAVQPAKLPPVPSPKAVLTSDLSEEAIGGKVDALIDTVGRTILLGTPSPWPARSQGRTALVGQTSGHRTAPRRSCADMRATPNDVAPTAARSLTARLGRRKQLRGQGSDPTSLTNSSTCTAGRLPTQAVGCNRRAPCRSPGLAVLERTWAG